MFGKIGRKLKLKTCFICLGCQKYMSVIIEGEALLNDGVATLVFRICLVLLQSLTPHYPDQTGEHISNILSCVKPISAIVSLLFILLLLL